jgi:hypothetical protein
MGKKYTLEDVAKILMNLKVPDCDHGRIDFFEFAKTFIENMRNNGREKSAKNYEIAVRNLEKFLCCNTLDFNEITATFCKQYYDWMIKSKLGERGQELYFASMRAIFNQAVSTFNDYDIGKIIIKTSPFKGFKIPKSEVLCSAEKKALPVEKLRKIFTVKCSMPKEELARDVFSLSFFLCGINAVDLFTCERIEGTQLIYYRSKIKNKGLRNSEMRINIPTEALYLMEKYKAKKPDRVFIFSERYVAPDNFTSAINKGLKRINEKLSLNLPGLSLYYARHSWATIAVNDVNLPNELVDECLVHVPIRKMLRIYVKRDWSRIDKANRKVLDYVFYGKTPPEGSVSIWHGQM